MQPEFWKDFQPEGGDSAGIPETEEAQWFEPPAQRAGGTVADMHIHTYICIYQRLGGSQTVKCSPAVLSKPRWCSCRGESEFNNHGVLRRKVNYQRPVLGLCALLTISE